MPFTRYMLLRIRWISQPQPDFDFLPIVRWFCVLLLQLLRWLRRWLGARISNLLGEFMRELLSFDSRTLTYITILRYLFAVVLYCTCLCEVS